MKLTEFENLQNIPDILIDLRYAGTDNFMKRDVYGTFTQALLHPVAYAKLAQASLHLQKTHPQFRFKILDALRPRRIQRILFSYVSGSDLEKYVAHPDRGSIHNYGLAVDLTLADASGADVDMGSGFDQFSEQSEPQHEERHLIEGRLTHEQVLNRRILRASMQHGGFHPISDEWWHFEAITRDQLDARFIIVE